MYEHFTDRARKILQLANSEVQRFQHEYIGTEHVLLGLVLEGTGVAATVLKQMGVSLTQVRNDVEELMISGPSRTRGKFPITPLTQKVIAHAISSARELGHNYVGSEHLLLGLLHVNQGIASQALRNLGVTSAKAIAGIKSILGVRETPVSHDAGEYNPYAPPKDQGAAIHISIRARSGSMRGWILFQAVVMLVALCAEAYHHESIVASGPVFSLVGLVIFVLAFRSRDRPAMIFGGSAVLFSLLIVLLINVNSWGPARGDLPITIMSWTYALIAGPMAIRLALQRVDGEKL